MSPIPIDHLATDFCVLDATAPASAALDAIRDQFGDDPTTWVVVKVGDNDWRIFRAGSLFAAIEDNQALSGMPIVDMPVRAGEARVVDGSVIGVGEADRLLARTQSDALFVFADKQPRGLYFVQALGVDDAPTAAPPPAPPPAPAPPPPPPPTASPPMDAGFGDEVEDASDDGDVARADDDDVSDGRRLGVDIVLDGRNLANAFVQGSEHSVRISIGRTSTLMADAPIDEPDFAGKDEVELPVWVNAEGILHTGSITLPADTRLDARTPFEFPYTPRADTVAIDIAVYEPGGNSVLQAARLTGSVVASTDAEADADPSISLSVVEVSLLTGAPDALPKGSVVHSESGLITKLSDMPVGVGEASAAGWIEDALSVIESAASKHHVIDAPEQRSIIVEKAIVELARKGAIALQKNPALKQLAPFDRIQVVSLTDRVLLPLELLYSGPRPDKDATLCADWAESLSTGECVQCGNGGPPDKSTVCPAQFWSMSKVIEHHAAAGQGSHFQVSGIRSVTTSTLADFGRALVGASARVSEEDDQAVARVTEALKRAFGDADLASDWDEWTAKVAATDPGLLVVMPHQGADEDDEVVLEIGGMSDIVPDDGYVTSQPRAPGPVVVLLGCDTGAGLGPMDYSSAALFRAYGASVVVSSLGKVLAASAPEIAIELIDQLAHADTTADPTFGGALLRARRALLEESNLHALMLVSHGDNEWRMV